MAALRRRPALALLGLSLVGCSAFPTTPTPTPVPTETPVPVPTATPVPTPIPTPPPRGIGVGRAAYLAAFGPSGLGFSFEPEGTFEGQPQLIGRSPDQAFMLQMIGPPTNLSDASLTIPSQATAGGNAAATLTMSRFIGVTDPDWSDQGVAWVAQQAQAGQSGQYLKTTHGHHLYSVGLLLAMGMISVDVEPA